MDACIHDEFPIQGQGVEPGEDRVNQRCPPAQMLAPVQIIETLLQLPPPHTTFWHYDISIWLLVLRQHLLACYHDERVCGEPIGLKQSVSDLIFEVTWFSRMLTDPDGKVLRRAIEHLPKTLARVRRYVRRTDEAIRNGAIDSL